MVLENSNFTKEELAIVKADVKLDRVILNDVIDTNESTGLIQLVSNYIIFFILLLCLNKIANTISQEKMSKSIEYILTSISTKEYLISKVLSMALIVVVQFIFEVAYLLIAIMVSNLITTVGANIDGVHSVNAMSLVSTRTIEYIVITFVFMCLTTFLQGVIQSVMSAKTTNIQEAGNATIVLLTINLVLYTVVTAVISPLQSAGVLAYIISVLPIASMYFVPSMFLIGQANAIQLILAFVILVASIPLSLILVQKPFKNAILDYSSKKDKKIDGIEKIIATREYQERMIERKESSKKGLVIGMAVIILILLQVITAFGSELVSPILARKITAISQENITLILMCVS
jgi:ABC-2 type transport system permease protein